MLSPIRLPKGAATPNAGAYSKFALYNERENEPLAAKAGGSRSSPL